MGAYKTRKAGIVLEKYGFEDLLDIMEKLRSDTGCPWDREQTHKSIRGNMLEEAEEACEAIDSGEPYKLYDELGDVLLQVVFHAQIAKENGDFDITDVTNSICRKLIRRHPHIFGDTNVSGSGEVLYNWDLIKEQEKAIVMQGRRLDTLTDEEVRNIWKNARANKE